MEQKFNALAVTDLFSDTPIDLEEVQARVYELLTIIEEHMLPLMMDYAKNLKVGGAIGQKRRREAGEKISQLLEDMGVTTSGESGIAVGQPCMLIWSALSSSGERIDPILIELARVTSVDEHATLGLDVIPLLEIPFGTTEIRRAQKYSNTPHRRKLSDGQNVLLPLTGTGADLNRDILLQSGE